MGYYHANAISVKSYTVTFLGLPLYDIVLNGKTYAGTAIGSNIETLCSFFAFVALMIEEAWLRLVRRRQKSS
ncbi:hypothetical protein D3839_07175 [Streptococcus mutans]|nr:hypothetical protein [Streptococcus mutans]NLQ97482.1 hypothetical protein [Streptococcus mutans]PNM01761.1 hypothetical protein A6J86_000010 [Streptococcus mutans]PNM01847.1 hypothetical protein A6J86_010260 [Streptococcus mutans]